MKSDTQIDGTRQIEATGSRGTGTTIDSQGCGSSGKVKWGGMGKRHARECLHARMLARAAHACLDANPPAARGARRRGLGWWGYNIPSSSVRDLARCK